jgi:predicted protein tyrosine phosphatase
MNILFVCSRNKWRSRTAETIFRNNSQHKVQSAGTESSARIRVNEKMIRRADIIFAMEQRHKQILKETYPLALEGRKIVVLDIADDYQYMDPELVATIKQGVAPYF